MTATTLQDLIGERFENLFQFHFPDFVKQRDGSNFPDYSNGMIWIETKTGFRNFGVRLKQYQIQNFPSLSSETSQPVLYAIGYHDFENATARLAGKRIGVIRRILRKCMNIERAYLVSEQVVSKIWEGENHVAVKTGKVYCMLKERFLIDIITGKSFMRSGVVHNPMNYYALDPSRLFMQSAPAFDLTKPSYGVIVDKNDEVVMNFLRNRNII